MLTYLINVTGDLLFPAIVIGAIYAFIHIYCGERSRKIFYIGTVLGFAVAGIRTYITNTRRLTGGWRVGTYGYAAVLLLFALLLVLLLVFGRRFFSEKQNEDAARPFETVITVNASLFVIAVLYCALPNVYIYPFKFDTGGNGLLSTDYLFRLGGYLLGILVSLVAFVSVFKLLSLAYGKGYRKAAVLSVFAINTAYAVYIFARLMLVLIPRKIVNSITLFNFSAFSNNHSHYYTYFAFAVLCVVAVLYWIGSGTKREPYSTKAEHRRQRALWRSGKRYSGALAVCFAVAILCATWFVELNTVVIREAPVEDPLIIKDGTGNDTELRVPLEMVSDGHLHRFGYTTDDGNPVRFIVILKQENTTNFGIGLDACDICGEAGYYENNEGQIVCKKCGVVMNTTTIGMKGGCNPIIIDYDINEEYITVPVSEMVNNQSRFKK